MKIENTLNTKIVALAIALCITGGLFFSINSFYQDRNYKFKVIQNNISSSYKKFEYKFNFLLNDLSENLSLLSQPLMSNSNIEEGLQRKLIERRILNDNNFFSLYELTPEQYKDQFKYLSKMTRPISKYRPLTKLNAVYKVKKTDIEPEIIFNKIIKNGSGSYILAQADITELFNQISEDFNKNIFIDIHYNGSLIKSSHVATNVDTSSTIPLAEVTHENFIYDGSDPFLRIVNLIPVDRSDNLEVFYSVDRKALLNDLTREFHNNLFLLIALSLIAIFVTLLITQNIIRPIHQLISLSGKIEGNDIEGHDDVERISNTLNHLSQELFKSNELLLTQKMALDSAAIVAETDPAGVITYVNDKFVTLSGYEKEELLGNTHRVLNSGYHPKSFFEELWDTIRSGKVWNGEIKNRAKDGSFYWLNTTIYPFLDNDGEVLKYITIRFDISERKKVEHELIHAQKKTEDIIHARTAFFANMNHEIRTPLNTILGISEVLAEINQSPEQQAHIRSINKSGETLLKIVNEVLDISKLESGQITLEKTPFCSMCVFEEAMDMLVLKKNSGQLTYILDLDPAIPKTLIGDQHKIRQIIINLLGNASKFTTEGHIMLKTKLLVKDQVNREAKLAISVKDTGRGIEKEAQKTIFDSFMQSDSSITRNYGGTGLGLTIVKHFVEEMGGTIHLDSKLAKGSAFTITLDLPYREKSSNDEIFQSVAGKSILILDSNIRDAKILEGHLTFHNAKNVTLLNDPSKVHRVIQNENFEDYNFIFVDQKLQKDHTPILKYLKSKYPHKSNSIIAILGNIDADNLKSLKASGVGLFTSRPIKPTEVFLTLHQIETKFTHQNLLTAADNDDEVKTLVNQNKPNTQEARTPINKKLQILIADDSVDNQNLMKVYFKNTGHNLIFANDGQEAIELFKENPTIDFIFMDIKMPIIDGLSASKEIRLYQKENSLPPIPIIALTANAIESNNYDHEVFDNYLTKPIKKKTILKCIEQPQSKAA